MIVHEIILVNYLFKILKNNDLHIYAWCILSLFLVVIDVIDIAYKPVNHCYLTSVFHDCYSSVSMIGQ